MGHYECKKCGMYYDDCECGKTPVVVTNTTSPGPTVLRRVVERRAGDSEIVNKPAPSARGSVTVRRPDGTTITCTIDQLQDVLEQVHKVRPRPIEITCTAPSLTPLTDDDPDELARNLGISLE